MTSTHSHGAADMNTSGVAIRSIGLADLIDALKKGLDDFKAKPSHIILLIIIYPILGLLSARIASGSDVMHLIFPLVSGFALVGPVAAIGLYELSRRREQGLDVSWAHAFGFVRSHSIVAIMVLSVLLGVIYLAWLGAAQIIYTMIFGDTVPTSFMEFTRDVMNTPNGQTLIVAGCGVGFVFALVVLVISAVSFPMLLDRDVSALTAVRTSVRVFMANPATMAMWGLIVAGALVLGSLPLFVGLVVVMPVLGHATWHLYRKAVAFK